MARNAAVVLLLVFAVISCVFAGEVTSEVAFTNIPVYKGSRKTSETTGTVQFIDIPKAGATAATSTTESAVRKFSKKSSAAAAAAEPGTVQMLDTTATAGAASSTAAAATTTTTASTKTADSGEGVKFLNILKPLSNLFGSGDTTTSTTVPKASAAGAVQFLDATATTTAATTADAAPAKGAAAGEVQMLDVAPEAATTSTTAKASKAVQFVDMTPATTDASTLVGAAAATKAKTSYLRKSESALAAAADATSTTSTTSPKYSKSFSTGAYSDVNEVLQKKILQTSKALDASETLEGSLKLADLLVKLSEALNNLAGK